MPTAAGKSVKGRIRIVRKAGEREETLVDEPHEIKPGKTVFPFRQEIDQPDFYTYEARFVPDDAGRRRAAQNNLATAFTHVQGKGQVLLIENWETPGEFDYLVERLRNEGLEVVVQPSNRLFTSLPELQRYDTVILADVPRSSGDDAGQRQQLQRRADQDARPQHRGARLRPDHAGRPEQLRRRRLDEHRAGKGDAGRFPDQEREGGAGRRAGAEHARQRNSAGELLAEGDLPGSDQGARAARLLRRGVLRNGTDQWLWGQSQGGMVRVGPNRQMMLARIDRMADRRHAGLRPGHEEGGGRPGRAAPMRPTST